MVELLDLRKHQIPDGILHDQMLSSASIDNKLLKLTFDIKWHEFDYEKNEFAQKYRDYKRCTIELDLSEYNDENIISLYSALKSTGEFKGAEIQIPEFIKLVNQNEMNFLYLYTYVSDRNIIIEFSAFGLSRRMKKYCSCELRSNTDEIRFIWE